MGIWAEIMYTKNFSLREMACKCGCGSTKMDAGFMVMLQLAREYAGIPFNISSGARCIVHNKRIGGKKDSAHLPDKIGESHAADITFRNGFELFIIINALFKAGFKAHRDKLQKEIRSRRHRQRNHTQRYLATEKGVTLGSDTKET